MVTITNRTPVPLLFRTKRPVGAFIEMVENIERVETTPRTAFIRMISTTILQSRQLLKIDRRPMPYPYTVAFKRQRGQQ